MAKRRDTPHDPLTRERVLAAEVGRLMRSLSTQKLK